MAAGLTGHLRQRTIGAHQMLPGTKLGPYEIIEPLGRGGMGEVYRARDTRLQRQVAIKTIASAALTDSQSRERFDREARAVAALTHPNILAIYDVGTHDSVPYVAVELLEGETLRSRIGASPLPLSAVLEYAVQIGRGLAAAHDRGIVHRDLKPENIFVTHDGQIKLLDFGLATEPVSQSGDDSTRLETEPGALLGTVGYMSPEQANGKPADARSDIFSFGCVLFEMLSGERAFKGDSRIETLHAILKAHPPDLATIRRDVPTALDRVVRRCLEKAPASRFQSARDLVFAVETLSGVSGDQPPAASPAAPSRLSVKWTTVATVAVVALAGAAVLRWTTVRDHPGQASDASLSSARDPRRLLAVLPFENISKGGEGYFAAGMTEEVTSQLAKLNGLRVTARTAVAQFKDPRRQLAAMSKELGIGSVVTGTVREDGGRVRVNVELIDAMSGQLIWSEQYDREGVDVFAAQSDIALRVGDALNASVTLEEQARIGRRPTASVAAYELYIRARNAVAKTSEQRLALQIELLRKAVALDPRFALAYAELANAHYFQGAYGDLSALARGVDAANRALEIDPQLATAWRTLGLNLSQLGRQHEALAAHRKGAALGPNDTGVMNDLSHSLSMAGQYDEALAAARRAAELKSAAAIYHVGVALLLLGDDAQTERYLAGKMERSPDYTRLPLLLALLDLRRGQPQAAVERIRALADKLPRSIEVLLTRAEILVFAGTADAPEIVQSLMTRAADGAVHSAPYPVKMLHAYHLHRARSTAEAAKILDAIVAANRTSLVAGANGPAMFVQNAAVHALRGEIRSALAELDRAYGAGWRDGRTLAIDPFFAPIRSEPRFSQLLSRIETDVAGMRARADYSALP
jgi:serine/threonine protein kinase/tetratricopeptide (TPR) repeat protein